MYYLHDKRIEGEALRLTAERVAWTDSRNLMTDDPDFGLRLMAATAMDRDRIKTQAGTQSRGRKPTGGDVYSYSLAWHPEEQGKITQADMLQAVDQSLFALGATEHQAVIVAHQDADHPHVHVILNMVNPNTGKNFSTHRDHDRLNKWSNEYRVARNEEHFCPNKAKKYEAIEAKKRGEKVDYVKGENEPRQFWEEKKAANENTRPEDRGKFKKLQAEIFKNETVAVTINGKTDHLNLSEYGKYLKNKQETESEEHYQDYRVKKKQISLDHKREKQYAINAVREQMKPAFSESYRQHDNDCYYWKKRDKTLIGKLQNTIATVKITRELGRPENKHFISSLYSALSNTGRREQALRKRLNANLRELRKEQRQQIKDAVSMVDQIKSDRLKSARTEYQMKKHRLGDQHKLENSDHRQRWAHYAKKKRRAFEALRAKGHINAQDEKLITKNEGMTAKPEFEEKRETQANRERRKRKPRSRSRKR